MHVQRPDRGNQYGHIRLQSGVTVNNVKELLGAQIGGETALGDHIIRQLEGHPRG